LRLYGDFAVCAQDIDGAGDLLVDILDKLLDGFAEDGAFLRGERVQIWRGECRDLGGAFRLLALAGGGELAVALAELCGVGSLEQLTSRPCVVYTPRDPS
jgi:hypothetical protein